MSEFRTICRLTSNSDAKKIHQVFSKKAKELNLELKEYSIGSLSSFLIKYDEIEESATTDGTLITVEVFSEYQYSYNPCKDPYLLSWLLDAAIIPGTEKPFYYHDNEPYLLKNARDEDIIQIIDHEFAFLLPTIYVPYNAIDDVNELNLRLRGRAHVIYECSEKVGEIMKKMWLLDDPNADSCRIIFPTGNNQDIDLSSFDNQQKINIIMYAVNEWMKKDIRFSYLSWYFLNDEFDASFDDDIAESKVAEDALIPSIAASDDKDELVETIYKLYDELEKEKSAKHKAEMNAKRWKELYESSPNEGRITLSCSEKDLYVGECHDALLYLIDSRIKEIEGGERNPEKLRYYTLLKSLQASNSKKGDGEKLRKDIEEVLEEKSLSALKAKMEKLGFEDVTSSGHQRFNFCADSRYTLVIASTPSDRAGRKNASSSKVMKTFFPF